MNCATRPGAASYALFGALFGAPAIILAAHSYSNQLPLLYSPMVLFFWAIPIAGWLYLSSLKMGITDETIYLERFYFQRQEFQFTEIAGVSFHSRRGPTLDISIRGKEEPVSIALTPFDTRSLRILVQSLEEHVKVSEDRLALTKNPRAT